LEYERDPDTGGTVRDRVVGVGLELGPFHFSEQIWFGPYMGHFHFCIKFHLVETQFGP